MSGPNMIEINNAIEKIKQEVGMNSDGIVMPDFNMIKNSDIRTIAERNTEIRIRQTGTEVSIDIEDEFTYEYDENGFRPLTEEEAKQVQEATHMNAATIKNVTINDEGVLHVKCRNEAKENDPDTEVPYVKVVIEVNGYQIEVVMPEFDSVFDVQLPDELLYARDAKQFEYCTKALQQAIIEDPSLVDMFTDEQMEQIVDGEPYIDGYTWHHCAESGSMSLVSTQEHEANRHTGGKAIWGGGRP